MKRKSLISFAFVVLLCAQSTFSQRLRLIQHQDKSEKTISAFTENSDYSVSSVEYADDVRDTTQIFPARGGNVDLGLALSGGGLRSAAFSIGVMKALYDKKILDEVDVISSASGGGYASYWLFTQYDTSDNNFGDSAFKTSSYIRNICELQSFARSNALPNKYLLKTILNFKKNGAFKNYKEALEASFGNGAPPATSLDTFHSAEIVKDKVPYFIINTTLRLSGEDFKSSSLGKDKEIKKRLNSVVEITPEFRGNPAMRFTNWEKGNKNNPTLSESIAISGAPKWRLEYSIENPSPDVIKGKTLRLSDGGHSENLAALALIRRGIKNVIIVDAEQDPTYKFGAYRDLKKMLDVIDIKFSVKDIDDFLVNPKTDCFTYEPKKDVQKKVCSPPGVSIGEAIGKGKNPIKTNIYYVKMSQPESIYSGRFSDDDAYNAGEKLSCNRRMDRCKVQKCDDDNEKTCSCNDIKSDFIKENKDLENLYTYEVKNYSDYINYPFNRKLGIKLKFLNIIGKIYPFFSYKFPHTTTVDQSFYSDQMEAFVGLGYLQTTELKTELEK